MRNWLSRRRTTRFARHAGATAFILFLNCVIFLKKLHLFLLFVLEKQELKRTAKKQEGEQ
jgi:hypothetical protein